MIKRAMLRLRNRTLNKFKVIKPKLNKSKVIRKVPKISKLGYMMKLNTLRVVPIVQTSGKTSPTHTKPPTPVKMIGRRIMNSIIGHRRMYLRNRRLMNSLTLVKDMSICNSFPLIKDMSIC